jgi:hypothetical protein
MSVLIRRITLAALLAAFVGGSLALPASSKTGPVASASKCKKAKKGKHKKKKKKCGGGRSSEATLPGQSTHSTPTQPPPPPPAVGMRAIGVTDNPILGGTPTSGQVTINGAAPSGGQPVALHSSDPTVTVPTGVVVATGQTTAGFSVDTTHGVAATATLTASIGGSNVSTDLKVVAHPSVASVTLQRTCFTAPGTFPTNQVTLDVPAPVNTVVSLASSVSTDLAVPPTVTVPSGSKSALFGVNTSFANPLVTVTAALAPSPSASDTASVRDLAGFVPAATGLSLNPDTVTAGGTSTGTVTLDCEALHGGEVVDLVSSDPSKVVVAPTVTVDEDELTATFQISTNGTTADGDYTISATAEDGGPTRQATLTVDSTLAQ